MLLREAWLHKGSLRKVWQQIFQSKCRLHSFSFRCELCQTTKLKTLQSKDSRTSPNMCTSRELADNTEMFLYSAWIWACLRPNALRELTRHWRQEKFDLVKTIKFIQTSTFFQKRVFLAFAWVREVLILVSSSVVNTLWRHGALEVAQIYHHSEHENICRQSCNKPITHTSSWK